MKYLFLLCLIVNTGFLASQSVSGTVTDGEGQPLPFVNITANNGQTGTTTDLDGRFRLNVGRKITQLKFSYIGFKSKTLLGESIKDNMQIALEEDVVTLDEATVLPGENPAHRIIENTVANKELNNPENLESFVYKAYSKFWVTFNIDSLDPSIDTVRLSDKLDLAESEGELSLQKDTIIDIDSSGYNMHQFFSQRHLFFMETVTERKFRSGRDNETVLAQRTSGFKNPMFALLITQLQSFSFYDNYVGITGSEYLNPISRGSTDRYYFILEDTIIKVPGDTTYIISFRPRPNKGFRGMKGVLSINSTDWAIENVRAQPADEETMPVEIRQEYKRYGRHTWFPVSFQADIKLSMMRVNESYPEAIMRRQLHDVQLNIPLERKDISRASVSIDEAATKNTDSIFNNFRGDTLSSLESETYSFLDSVGEAENFEENLRLLLTLSRGYIPMGPVNLELQKLLNFNIYEGLRLGAGLETNNEFSKWLQLGGYYGYGFKDKVSKYGLNARASLNKNLRFAILGGYQFEIFESGGFDIPTFEAPGLFGDNYSRFFIAQWDESNRYYGAIQIDPIPTVAYELRVRHERRNTVGSYRFNYAVDDQPTAANLFYYSEMINTIRIAPEEEFAETPFGKMRLRGGYPVFWLSYTRGFQGVLQSDFAFDKLQVRSEYKRKTLRFGVTTLGLQGGVVFQDIPYQKNFVGSANAINNSNFFERNAAPADRNSFETMRFNEFLSDTYVELMWRQDFKSLLFKRGDFAPHLEFISRVAWGSLRNPELHDGIGFKTLEDGFFESGLEINRLYNMGFAAFGLGAYYRYGPNSFPNFADNLALKVTSKFSF